jgi:hypothetical protein
MHRADFDENLDIQDDVHTSWARHFFPEMQVSLRSRTHKYSHTPAICGPDCL